MASSRAVTGLSGLTSQVLLVFVLLAPSAVGAQAAPSEKLTPEVRIDAIVADGRRAMQAGGGLQIPAGYYARIGVIGAVGADVVSGGIQTSERFDVIGRFLFDPFRQNRWGLSAGAGVSLRLRAGDRVRPYLLTVLDLEGPRSAGGAAPSVQVGLGGGVRLGAAVRWVPRGSR